MIFESGFPHRLVSGSWSLSPPFFFPFREIEKYNCKIVWLRKSAHDFLKTFQITSFYTETLTFA